MPVLLNSAIRFIDVASLGKLIHVLELYYITVIVRNLMGSIFNLFTGMCKMLVTCETELFVCFMNVKSD